MNGQVQKLYRGDHQDGIVASDVYKYFNIRSFCKMLMVMKLRLDVDWGLSRVGEEIRGANFANPDGWQRETHWGINTGS
jgi:hypothetical protein